MERLFEGGALEVFTLPAGMKKARPGVLLTVLCAPEKRERMVSLLFQHTTTLGIREAERVRHILERGITSFEIPMEQCAEKNQKAAFPVKNFSEKNMSMKISRELQGSKSLA